MGVKDLWSILTPHAERKPICELRGKTVAIDLAGWVCESLNVVDYFVHPRHHLKNLFFRTCYLIWEEVTPVFVLEGVAPKLKSQVIDKRNEIQFRGAKPKETSSQSQQDSQKSKSDKGRTRFNHVLKQCENLLQAMGIQCVQGPGEAEAYCSFLNLKGLVDGVISQDSDCFAYGALRVYRNFSISSQGALAAQGGAVDIYDMKNICSKMDFGQNKVIVMALLCGCDYCPDGVGGVGRDSVLKLFNKYKNNEILQQIRSWRIEDHKYTAMEIKIDDKTICSYCGHLGRTQSHTKNGCGICRTNRGCDESLWKEERLSLKTELTLRKRALADPNFPSQDIIDEFLKQPTELPQLQLNWRQPNIIKFIKQVGHLLQWTEIYCFQKFFPILTRWQVLNAPRLKELPSDVTYVTPKEIIKKRVVKGVSSLELLWQDENGIFNGLIPDNLLQKFLANNPKGLHDLWSTVEPFDKVELAYPLLVESFLKSKEKPKKVPKKSSKTKAKLIENQALGSLENLKGLIDATNDIGNSLKPKRQKKSKKANSNQGLQMIERFFKQKINDKIEETNQISPARYAHKSANELQQCSTPITENLPSDLESDIDEDAFDMSDIVNDIVGKSNKSFTLKSYKGKQLCYDKMSQNISIKLGESIAVANATKGCIDDLDILSEKRLLSNSFRKYTHFDPKRMSLDDSFDVLVKRGNSRNTKSSEFKLDASRVSNIDRFIQKQRISLNVTNTSSMENILEDYKTTSYFFNNSMQSEKEDIFERFMEASFAKQPKINENNDDFVVLSD